MTGRVEKLRSVLLQRYHTQFRRAEDLSIFEDPNREEIEKEPVVVRKAKALALLADATSPIIMENELVIGFKTVYGHTRQGTTDDPFGGIDFDKPHKPLKIEDAMQALLYFPHYLTPAESEECRERGLKEGTATRHAPFGAGKILRHGFGAIRQQAENKLNELEATTSNTPGKRDFLRGVIITIDAASRFAAKHADEAESLADSTNDPARQKELKEIADTQNALELLECLWIKLNYGGDLLDDSCRNVTLSGIDETGTDVTNDLTYLCLEASLALRLPDPKINVRFHENSPDRRQEERRRSGRTHHTVRRHRFKGSHLGHEIGYESVPAEASGGHGSGHSASSIYFGRR